MAKETKKTMDEVQDEIMAEITDKFVSCLSKGIIPWHETWNRSNSGFIGCSGVHYSFMNTLLIAIGGGTKGEYVTLNELMNRTGLEKAPNKDGKCVWDCFHKVDGKIPKSHTVYLYHRNEWNKKDEKGNIVYQVDDSGRFLLDDKGKKIPVKVKGRMFLKSFNVWQVGVQVDCPLKYEKQEAKINNPIAEVEKIVVKYQAREGLPIENSLTTPSYNKILDRVTIPSINDYKSSEAYYSDLFHELAHSTGHEKRLNRELTPLFMDRKSYSFEELVAEISSCAIMHDKGINTKTTDKLSEAYIQGWSKSLKNNPLMVAKACGVAKKVADYIYNGKKK